MLLQSGARSRPSGTAQGDGGSYGCAGRRSSVDYLKQVHGDVLVESLVVEEDMPFDMIILQHLDESGSGLGGGPWEAPWGLNRG